MGPDCLCGHREVQDDSISLAEILGPMQVARLAVADKERVEGARAAAAHAYYSQFTFQPAINPKSKQLIRVCSSFFLENCLHLQTTSRTYLADLSVPWKCAVMSIGQLAPRDAALAEVCWRNLLTGQALLYNPCMLQGHYLKCTRSCLRYVGDRLAAWKRRYYPCARTVHSPVNRPSGGFPRKPIHCKTVCAGRQAG